MFEPFKTWVVTKIKQGCEQRRQMIHDTLTSNNPAKLDCSKNPGSWALCEAFQDLKS